MLCLDILFMLLALNLLIFGSTAIALDPCSAGAKLPPIPAAQRAHLQPWIDALSAARPLSTDSYPFCFAYGGQASSKLQTEPALPRLAPGAPFALYHPCLPPLAEAFHVCQQAKAAVRLQLLESWARKYQVAPNRTHPEMNAYPPTGYVLSGISVLPP